jgi:hypothetical protein
MGSAHFVVAWLAILLGALRAVLPRQMVPVEGALAVHGLVGILAVAAAMISRTPDAGVALRKAFASADVARGTIFPAGSAAGRPGRAA